MRHYGSGVGLAMMAVVVGLVALPPAVRAQGMFGGTQEIAGAFGVLRISDHGEPAQDTRVAILRAGQGLSDFATVEFELGLPLSGEEAKGASLETSYQALYLRGDYALGASPVTLHARAGILNTEDHLDAKGLAAGIGARLRLNGPAEVRVDLSGAELNRGRAAVVSAGFGLRF